MISKIFFVSILIYLFLGCISSGINSADDEGDFLFVVNSRWNPVFIEKFDCIGREIRFKNITHNCGVGTDCMTNYQLLISFPPTFTGSCQIAVDGENLFNPDQYIRVTDKFIFPGSILRLDKDHMIDVCCEVDFIDGTRVNKSEIICKNTTLKRFC